MKKLLFYPQKTSRLSKTEDEWATRPFSGSPQSRHFSLVWGLALSMLCTLCALPLNGMQEEAITFKFENAYIRENSPLLCYLEHPGYANRLTHFEVGAGSSEFDLVYTEEIARASYSICFETGKRPASGRELQFFFQEHPDANPDDADNIHTCKLVEFKLDIKPYTRISHTEKALTLPAGDEISFTVAHDKEDPNLFSVLVGVAQSSQFVPSKDPLRDHRGIPIKNQRARTWSMNTPMISKRVVELWQPN